MRVPARGRAIAFYLVLYTALGLITLAVQPPESQAAPFYTDVGIGLGQIREGAAFFEGSGLASSPGLSLAGNFAMVQSLGGMGGILEVHLGVKGFYNTASQGGNSYSTLIPYPMLRFDLPRFYFSAGASPFLWASSSGVSFSRVPSAVAGFADFGLLWRIVPFFNLALEASAQMVQKSGADLSPRPAWTAALQMRFYVLGTDSSGSGGGGAKRPRDGWRYPFGMEL